MLQHAVHSVADRAHGYCVDDNARALLFSSALASSGEAQLPEPVTARFAAFIQHAWNPDTRRFRNFMSYDRRWLEDVGLGGQSRADALGIGRMRTPRHAIHLAADGLRRCSRPRFPRSKSLRRRAPGPSRSWGWTPIAGWSLEISLPTACVDCWPTG